MANDQNFPYPDPSDDDILGGADGFSVQSANECTGLIPNGILSEEEKDSYSDIYDIPVPKINATDEK